MVETYRNRSLEFLGRCRIKLWELEEKIQGAQMLSYKKYIEKSI